MKLVTLAGLAALCSLVSGAALAACEDDPRMFAVADFVAAAKAGKVEPMRLTPTTFLNLTPRVREAFGDKIMVLDNQCKPMQVFTGEPPTRLEAPFPILYNAFYDSVLRGDKVTTTVILNSFKAAPTTPLQIMALAVPVSPDPEITSKLAMAASLKTSNTPNTFCSNPVATITKLELFARFGGTSSDNSVWVGFWEFTGTSAFFFDVETDTAFALKANSNDSCQIVGPPSVRNALSGMAL